MKNPTLLQYFPGITLTAASSGQNWLSALAASMISALIWSGYRPPIKARPAGIP